MAKLILSATASLDGFIEDAGGGFQWAAPDEEVHAHINDRHRGMGTFLHGRRMYETMLFWETFPDDASQPGIERDWARIWRGAHKVVYSRTLHSPSSADTEIERSFDPGAVRALVDAADRDVAIGGAGLGGQAVAAGIVDEMQLHIVPVIVGGGKSWLPAGARCELELLESRRFANGFLFARYRVASTRNRRL
jgi:dihydrofolate reductase